MDTTRVDRSRQNEERFAAANDRIKDVAQSLSVETVPFLCECSDARCTKVIPMLLDSYRQVREHGWFLLSPGHDDPHVEMVVEERDAYVVVEKFGS
jgi:hypothetical protein